MSYLCTAHGWAHHNFSCPACAKTFTSSGAAQIQSLQFTNTKMEAPLYDPREAEIKSLQSRVALLEKKLEIARGALKKYTDHSVYKDARIGEYVPCSIALEALKEIGDE